MLRQFQLTTFPPQSCSPMCGWQITSEGMQKDLHLCVWHLSLARRLLARPSMALCTSILFHTVSGTQQEISRVTYAIFSLLAWKEQIHFPVPCHFSSVTISHHSDIHRGLCKKKSSKTNKQKRCKRNGKKNFCLLETPFLLSRKTGKGENSFVK